MSRNRRVFAFLLMVVAVIATGPVPTAFAGVAPPDGLIAFAIYAPGGTDVGAGLEGIVAVQPAGGDWWMGAAKRQVFAAILEAGFKPVFVVPGTEDRFGSRDAGDADADGLSDADEAIYNTDPMNPDSDQDFLSDGDEVHTYGTWPLRESTDGDRYDDGQEVLGFSPSGLGALGGDMPGYVLAPGDDPFVAAYPKIDFEVRDGIEMQANVETEIGSSTMTTETKTKSTTQRTLDMVEVGGGANVIQQNQRGDNPEVMAGMQNEIEQTQDTMLKGPNGSPDLYVHEVTTGGGIPGEPTNDAVCGLDGYYSEDQLACFGKTTIDPLGVPTSQMGTVHSDDDQFRVPFDVAQCGLYRDVGSPKNLEEALIDVMDETGVLNTTSWWIDPNGRFSFGDKLFVVAAIGVVAGVAGIIGAANDVVFWWRNRQTDKFVNKLQRYSNGITVNRYEAHRCVDAFNTIKKKQLYGISASAWALATGNSECLSNACIQAVMDYNRELGFELHMPFTGNLPKRKQYIREDLPVMIFQPATSSDLAEWNRVAALIRDENYGKAGDSSPPLLTNSQELTYAGGFDYGANLTLSHADFGTGMEQRFLTSPTSVIRRVILEDADDDGDDDDDSESDRRIPVKYTHLQETIVTETYSWSVTQEDWEATTTDSADFGTVTFSFNVRNTGTDMALDAAGLRFNLFIGDNPATPEVEDFNPITFPQIQDPAITFSNVGPGDELLFGATVHLQKQQFRALDEGASLKIAVADYSYGSDELYYRSAAGGGVRFLIDNGVLEPEATRYEEYLVPVQQVWDDDLGRLRAPTYGETLAQVVEVEHDDGILRSINGRPITDSAWWSMMLTTPTDASLFYKSTALEGQTVRMEYHGDADSDYYADAVELEHGTDVNDPEDHPAPVIIGALYEEPDPDNPGWTLGRFKVTNTGTYEAYGMEARIYATDSDIEITDALVGGSGLVNPGETWEHPDDTFRYRATGGATPLLEIRYNDPEGLHILLSTVTLASLDDDITGIEDLMVQKERITADAIDTWFYDVPGRLTVGYKNPTNRTVQDAWIVVDWQSLMGDILHHESRQIDLSPGDNFASFDFKPQDYLSPINIGGRFKALVRVMDHNGALVDSKVWYGTLFPRLIGMYAGTSPRVAVSPTSISISEVPRGTIAKTDLSVANVGSSMLEYSTNTSSPTVHVLPTPSATDLAPGAVNRLRVTVDTLSLEHGDYAYSIQFHTTDPTKVCFEVPIYVHIGSGLKPPIVAEKVEGLPLHRKLTILGDYPEQTVLLFDSGFQSSLSNLVPVQVFDENWEPLDQAVSLEPLNLTTLVTKKAPDSAEMKIALPANISGRTTYFVSFGYLQSHDCCPPDNSYELGIELDHRTHEKVTFEVQKHQDNSYDPFDTAGPPDPALWITGETGTGSIGVQIPENIMSIYTYAQYGTTPENNAITLKSILDLKNSPYDVFEVDYELKISASSTNTGDNKGSIYHKFKSYSYDYFLISQSLSGTYSINEQYDKKIRVELDEDAHEFRHFENGNLVYSGPVPGGKINFNFTNRGQSEVSNVKNKIWTNISRVDTMIKNSPLTFDFGLDGDVDTTLLDASESSQRLNSGDVSSSINEYLQLHPPSETTVVVPVGVAPSYRGSTLIFNMVDNVQVAGDFIDLELLEAQVTGGGDAPEVHMTVRNNGTDASPPFVISTFIVVDAEDELIGSTLAGGGLDAGEEGAINVPSNQVLQPGEYVLKVRVDPLNNVEETDELNNSSDIQLSIPSFPDLRVAGLTLENSPNVISLGVATSVIAVLEWTGSETIGGMVSFVAKAGDGSEHTLGYEPMEISGGAAISKAIQWVPLVPGAWVVCAKAESDQAGDDMDADNNQECVGVEVVLGPPQKEVWIDAGGPSMLDPFYGKIGGFGFLNGLSNQLWGALPSQSARYDLGGSVQYRFDYLDPTAIYHLDATFFEGDGIGRIMGIFVDDTDTGVSADLSDGLIHRVSATLNPVTYAEDGSIVVDFRRQGPGDALINEIRLVQVDHRGIDCGDDGTTDFLFDPAIGHGFLNGSADSSWGTEPEHSVRYSATGELLYRFDGLEAAKNYKISAVFYEGDGAGREEALQIDGGVLGTPVLVNSTPQTAVVFVEPSAYVDDASVLVRISRRNGTSSAVVSELVLEEDTLPRRTLSDATVTPDAGDGTTVFSYQVSFTDLTGAQPSEISLAIDGGTPDTCVAADPGDNDSTDGMLYICQASGLSDGLHDYAFAAVVAGEPAAGDVFAHTGPLVGGPTLPDASEFGYLPAGDQSHDEQVIYAFAAATKTLHLGFEVYDVDSETEVEILLNGELLATAEITDDGQWSGARDLLLPAAMLRDDTANHLVFKNTVNRPSGTEPWGVRTVSLLAERPEGVSANDIGADDGHALLIQWQASADDGSGLDNVVEYRVSRADSPIGPWSQIATAGPGEDRIVDSGLDCERTYWYQVEAWNGFQISAVNLRASGVPLDNVPPLIAGASPLQGATAVPLNAAIVLHVSDSGQGVDQRSLQARINGAYINPALAGDPGFYTLTLQPRAPLPADSEVIVSLEAADLANPANAAETFNLTFHTAPDTQAPYVFAASPADGATGIDPDAVLSLHLRDDGLGVDETSLNFTVNGISVPPVVTGEPNDLLLTYDPASSFTAGQVVTLTVSAADLATPANSMSSSWSFTIATGEEGPVIVDFSPVANQVVIDGTGLDFSVTAQDDSLDVMSVDWSVDGTPGASGITLNGSGGGSWQARTPIVISGGAADYTDETVTIQLGSHSTTPADYLVWDDFTSLDAAWQVERAAPTAAGSLDLTTSGSELSAEVDSYAFVYQSQSFAGDWYAEAKVTANNSADSDGAGLLARVNADTWYFVGQVWDAGLAADAVALRFQTGAMSVVNLPAAEAAATVYVRFVKIGNLLHAAYRLNTASPWTELGYAPIIVDDLELGLAAWDNTDTLNASFDDFRLNDAAHPPIATTLTGATEGFADLRVTEDDGVSERLVPFSLSDSDADEVADTLSFPADTTSPGVWKSYWVYSGNPAADALAVEVLPGSDALAETAVFGVEAPVAAASFNWSATPVGDHTVAADVSDGTSSDFMSWQVEVVATSPDQPAGLTAVAGDSAVLLAWTLSDRANVAGYNVYRSGAGPLNAEPLTEAAYADTGLVNGAEYCYTVRAVSPDAVEGPDSVVACATPHDQTVPSPPPLVAAVGQDQAVQLTWYGSWATDLAGYNVYRRLSGVGDLIKITGSLLVVNTHLDSGLTNGTAYDYAVTTVDSSGNESALSMIVSATPEALAPDVPGTLSVSQLDGTITLDWAASGSPDVAGYRVYRSFVSGMLYELQTPAPIGVLTFDDDTGIEGLTYYYVVSAVGTNGAESVYTNEVEITLNIDPGAPKNLNAGTGNREVALDWDANTEDDLAGYSVYRSDSAGGPYTKISSVLLEEPTYTDTAVVVDQTYYYVVTAVDELNAESEYSNEDDAAPDRAHVIVVNDEGDAAYAEGVATAVRSAGSFVDQWDVRLLGSPELSDLSDYDVAIWNLGPEYQNTISGEEQTTLIAFLEGGGSLAVFGQDLIYDLGVSNTLLNDYLHVVGATEDSCGQQVLGLVDDPISDAMALPLTTPFGNTCDVLTPDGSALTVFTNDLGEAVALRADDGIASHTFFAAFAFEGVSETDAAPNNRTTLIARLLAWFNEPLAHIFADGFESNDTSAWDAATP